MPRKSGRNTKGRIVSAAWKLFYEQGYDNTTVEDIIFESETSKGSFYHYFEGKDALLEKINEIVDQLEADGLYAQWLAEATEDAASQGLLD